MKNGTHVSEMTIEELLGFVGENDPHGFARAEIVKRINELKEALSPLAAVGRQLRVSTGIGESYIWAENSNRDNPVRLSFTDAIRAADLLQKETGSNAKEK